jgi:threonine/homoserine/homoserine lactone efflux protein
LPVFLEAFALGIVVAAPPGPVSASVIRTGLLYGFAAAMAMGIGVAVVDGVYFVAAAAGASQAFRTAWLGVPLWLGGTSFLAYLGLSGLARRNDVSKEDASTPYSLLGSFARGVVITMANPLTVASWLAVAGSLAVSGDDAGLLVASSLFIAIGSATWTAFLSLGAAWSRRLAGTAVLQWSAMAASVLILAFGVRFLFQGLGEYVLQ